MSLVSIIVPIYNVENYIEQCVESILVQSHKEFELILVDDGSTDGSSVLCDEYAEKDSRIKVRHKKNGGATAARKEGVKISKGQYICFVDGDDWIEPDMIERLYISITEEHVDIAMCGRFEDTGGIQRRVYQGIPEGRYDEQELREQVFPYMIVNGAFFEWGLFPGLWDKMFRRECIEGYLYRVDNRITIGDDAACVYPCILNADSIYVLHECLYHYRQSTASMVKRNSDPALEREHFDILYRSVLAELEQYKEIYDLRDQWKEYLLFLMVPRGYYLYDNIENLDFLFPFPKVKKGSDIILYGMGTFGQILYRYLQETNFCNVIAVADRNYKELRKQGLSVIAPEDINIYKYDAVVVASSFAKTRKEIYQDLISRLPKKKVHLIDEIFIKRKDTMTAFRLI